MLVLLAALAIASTRLQSPVVAILLVAAGALGAAVYITSGIRGMERGSVSMDRDRDGNDACSECDEMPAASAPTPSAPASAYFPIA